MNHRHRERANSIVSMNDQTNNENSNKNTLRILKHLGSGVFGNVYQAYDVDTGNAYAIKMTKYNHTKPNNGLNEIQILKHLQHYNDMEATTCGK